MFFGGKKKIKKRREALCKEAEIFIQVHFVRERNNDRYKFNTLSLKSDPERDKVSEWYNAHGNPDTYSDIVRTYFDESGKNEDTLCNQYLFEKGYFTKLKKAPNYLPSKGEAVTACIAFHLTFESARVLLKSAGHALTNSEKSDLIIRYFLETENYNINDLNYVLNKLCDIKIKDIV